MAVAGLVKGAGTGKYKIAAVVTSITGTGAITTGLSSVTAAAVSVANSGTSIPTDSASVTSISGGTVNVVVTKHEASANSVETSAKNVGCIAFGY